MHMLLAPTVTVETLLQELQNARGMLEEFNSKAEADKKLCLHKLQLLTTLADKEAAHATADQALLAYINDLEITEAYEAVDKWYA